MILTNKAFKRFLSVKPKATRAVCNQAIPGGTPFDGKTKRPKGRLV